MDQTDKAFGSAADVTKQLITLATGLLALTITFKEKIVGPSNDWRWIIPTAWMIYTLSIVCGVWTLLALTGELAPKEATTAAPSIRGANVVLPSILQVALFVVATFFVVLFAALTL